MITISKVDESFLKIIGDFDDTRIISEYFTRYAPNYIWNPRYKAGVWDGKIRFYNLVTGLLPYGLKNKLIECINKNKIQYGWSNDFKNSYNEYTINEYIFKQIVEKFSKFKLNEHQIDGAWKAIKSGRGLLEHATSSGKTATLFLILSYYLNTLNERIKNEKIIIVVPNKGLIKQFCSNFEYYGMDPKLLGKYYGEEKDLSKIITVGTWQSFIKIPDFLKTITIAIGDEVHGAKAKEIKGLFEQCINSVVRIGVTGSLPKNECDLLTIIGGFSEVVDYIKTDELIKKQIVSPVEIIQINYYYPKNIVKIFKSQNEKLKDKDGYRIEKDIIQNNERRKILVRSLIARQRQGDNILLLFDELNFGESYFEYLKTEFPDKKIKYVAGDVSAKEREEIRKFANDNENVIIVASLGTYSTGIDIPRLHALIFLWMGKSDIRLKQSIGRGLRRHISKDKVVIWDICDQLKYSKNHARERLKIYMEEGYSVKSIEVGKET